MQRVQSAWNVQGKPGKDTRRVDEFDTCKVHVVFGILVYDVCIVNGLRFDVLVTCVAVNPILHLRRNPSPTSQLRRTKQNWEEVVVVKAPDAMRTGRL